MSKSLDLLIDAIRVFFSEHEVFCLMQGEFSDKT